MKVWLLLSVLTGCGPRDEGECRAWCEAALSEAGSDAATVNSVCGSVPDVVDGCSKCIDTWGEESVRDAHVSPICGCLLGAGSLSPQETCQEFDDVWESNQSYYESECLTEAEEFGYQYCLD